MLVLLLALAGCCATVDTSARNSGTISLSVFQINASVPATSPEVPAPSPRRALSPSPRPSSSPEVSVYFSPKGGCAIAAMVEIAKAKQTLQIEQYLFSSRPLLGAVLAAAKRGVAVTVLLDGSTQQMQTNRPTATLFAAAGVPVFLNTRYREFHNKVCIVDGEVVIGGSYNWTSTAESSNAENLTIIRDRPVAAQFAGDFAKHLAQSKRFVPASQPEK